MAVTNSNLLQEVQTLNQALDTSDTQQIQNKVADRLFGLFENKPSIVLNQEFLAELERTGNLANLANRITTTRGRLNQAAIQVNNTNIANTVVNPANTNTAENIQREINTITNTNIRNLDALPNQITRIRERLNQNRTILTQIEDIQTNINNTTNPNTTTQVIQNNINTTQSQLNACSSIRAILESIASLQIRVNAAAGGRGAQNLQGQLDSQIQNLTTQLGRHHIMLRQANLTITADPADVQANITRLTNEEIRLSQDLENLRQNNTDAQELVRLNKELQRVTRTLPQQTMAVPQNVGLNITNTVIQPANIGRLVDTTNAITQIDTELQQLDNLENDIQQLRNRYQQNIDTLNVLLPLQRLEEGLQRLGFTPGIINTRANEIQQFINIGQQILLIRQPGFIQGIPQITVDFGGDNPAINLPNIFIPHHNLGNLRAEYAICNNSGEELRRTGQELEGQLAGGQNVRIRGLHIDPATNQLTVNNLQITPLEGTSFPANLTLNVRIRIQDPVTGMNLDHFKPLNITINRPIFNQQARQTEVNAINARGNAIVNSMNAINANTINRLEREAFYRALERADGPKFNKLTAQQKEDLYQETRNTYRTNGAPTNGAQFAWAANLANINNFNAPIQGTQSFLEWITNDNHESNKPEFTINPEAYRAYIHNNLEEQIKKYYERRFDEVFSENLEGNTYLKAQLTHYLTNIENQKLDTDVHQDIEGDITPEDEMINRRRRGIVGRRDVNYLRFFAGKDSQTSIKDQIVNINTNAHPEDLNNPEPVKYDMDLEVTGNQQIMAKIKIDKQKEFLIKAGDPIALVRRVLRCPDIAHGKVRAHIVYNIMKGFIEMAKKKDISLRYRDPRNGHNMVIRMEEKNIVLEDQDDTTNYGGTNRRVNQVLFDYQRFENTNTFDSNIVDDNRSLRIGIDRLMGHFNYAMEELHLQYRGATERRWLGLRRGETRMTLPTSFRLSPLKKILNLRTTTNFDFTTNVQSNGKNVSIEFKRNKFTLQMEGLKKPISSRTLGKVLRHREGGIRVFDGMERDICGKIYEELIKKLRENNKVARTNFGVRDESTGRTYILDVDGHLGYISQEEANENPRLIRRGAAGGRSYGVVDHPPTGRHICDESETREVMKNPFLMGRLIKTMNNRMGLISSTRSLVN